MDSIASRIELAEIVTAAGRQRSAMPNRDLNPHHRLYYWMDFGNGQQTGQVVLGTVGNIQQPTKKLKGLEAVAELPDVLKMFPGLKDQKEDQSGPSCSLAEALEKQDLFINSTLCNLGLGIIWKMFRELRIRYHGLYLNLETMSVNPIRI